MDDFNWAMTGPPDPTTAITNPDIAASWNAYAAQQNELSGGAGQPIQTIDNSGNFVLPPAPTTPPVWLRPESYTSEGFAAPYTPEQANSVVNPADIRQGYGGASYAGLKGTSSYYDPTSAGEYLVNPNTNQFLKDASGNLIPVPQKPNSSSSGWFNDWGVLTLPFLAAGGVAALEGLGALGGAEAMGPTYAELGYNPATAGATSSGLMGPTYQELGYTGLEAGQMGPTYAELGYTGLNNAEAIAAADAAAAASAASAIPSWLSSLAGPAAKLGTSGLASALRQGATSGLAPSLGKLAQGQTGYGMEIPGIVRTNQNPFYNTPQVALQTPQKTELSTLSDLLRQGQPSWQT